jgi:hypothetical protein
VLGGSIIIEEDPDIIRPTVPLQLKGKLINAETINLEWNNFASIGFIGISNLSTGRTSAK